MKERILYECGNCHSIYVVTIIEANTDVIKHCPFCCTVISLEEDIDE